MSVIVKGMKMPKCCDECPMLNGADECCLLPEEQHDKYEGDMEWVRNDFCPLVELPEKHGYWNETKDVFECSECGYSFEHEGYKQYFNFCPCCGAEMREGQK